MNKIEFFKKLMNNEDCDMYEAILNLLENIGDAYYEQHRDGDRITLDSYGVETYYDRDIYCMGCVVDSAREIEHIKWRDILDQFWLQETGEWHYDDSEQKTP